MSIMRCDSHDLTYDSDFNVECPMCEDEAADWCAKPCAKCGLPQVYHDGPNASAPNKLHGGNICDGFVAPQD